MAHTAPLPQPALSCSFQQICDALPQVLLVLDAELHVAYANPAAEDFLHSSATAMEGKPLSQFIAPDQNWLEFIRPTAQFRDGVKERGLTLSLLKKNVECKVNAHAHWDAPFEGSSQPGLIVLMEHSAVSEKLDSHAAQREAMRSAAVMAEILAHEVRNPLAGIRGAAQLLTQNANTDDRELLALICSEVDRIGGLLKQVEYFSTEQELVVEAINIHEVLRYVRGIVGSAHGTIRFTEQYDPSLPSVRGNRELLVQALLNLVKNAAEAVAGRDDAEITLTTAYRAGFRMGAENLPICVLVRDNGDGIPAELAIHIFDPFVTEKPSGKGLGLSVVTKIIADHGGVVALEDGQAGSTTFALQLPAWKPNKS